MIPINYSRDIRHRRSIRLKGYDYSQRGAYFVTLCTQNKECLFGDIVDCVIRLNEFGLLVKNEWVKTADIRKEITLDEFCIMPNHIHGIVIIQNMDSHVVGANGGSPEIGRDDQTETGRPAGSPLRMKSKSISSLMAGFKSNVTKQINEIRQTPGVPIWQRNYYEHVVRDNNELNRIREYVMNNPVKWAEDEENPENIKHRWKAL